MSEASDANTQRFQRDPDAPDLGREGPSDKGVLGSILEVLRTGGVSLLFEKSGQLRDQDKPTTGVA